MSMNHVMTDVETMGKNPNAPIVAIGAVLHQAKHALAIAKAHPNLNWS